MASFLLFPLCLLLSLPFLSLAQLDTPSCPLLGPDFPAPVNPSGSQAILQAQELMVTAIQQALTITPTSGGLDSNATSFSLQLYSLYETDPLFTYHFAAPALANPTTGVGTVDSNTIYRIGSISKLFTVYMYLITAGDASFNDPITKYVPELAQYAQSQADVLETDDINTVDWNDITIDALASHLAGIGRDASFAPVFEQSYLSFGLPPVPISNASYCGSSLVPFPCDRAAFFEAFSSRHPTVAPFYTPSYSNAAFTLLGYALESITGNSLHDILSLALIDPLDLNSTSFAKPESDDYSIIPFDAVTSFYDSAQYERSAAAGYYSSINDMAKVGLSILNSTFLTPAQTRSWLKPKSFTSSINNSVGAPWEIFRAPGERVSYLYTKNGALGLYSSQMALMPDYNIGFTVLAGGISSSLQVRILSNLVSEIFHPALEAAAKEEATANYAGIYQDPNGANSSITIITDDRPGVGVQDWLFNGTDGFSILRALLSVPEDTTLGIRLYPTGLKTTDRDDGRVTRTAWRAVIDVPSVVSPGPFSSSCSSWAALDLYTYGGIGLDEFVFSLGPDGRAVSVEPRVLQQNALQQGPLNKMMVRRH